jgi:hypothetical protein
MVHADEKERNEIIRQALSRLPESIGAGIAASPARFYKGENLNGVLEDAAVGEVWKRFLSRWELAAVFAANKPPLPREGKHPDKIDIYPLTVVLAMSKPRVEIWEDEDFENLLIGNMRDFLDWDVARDAKRQTAEINGSSYNFWPSRDGKLRLGLYRSDDGTIYLGTSEILELVISRKNAEATPFVRDFLPQIEGHQLALAASSEWLKVAADLRRRVFQELADPWKSIMVNMDLSGKPTIEIAIACEDAASAVTTIEQAKIFRDWIGNVDPAGKSPDDPERLFIGYLKATQFEVDGVTARAVSRPEPFPTLRQIVLKHIHNKR